MLGNQKPNFNIRLTNHRKNVMPKGNIPARNHFDNEGHKYKRHAKFIMIEQLNQKNLDKSRLRKRLKIRENFWIPTLETQHLKILNKELNKI